MSHPIRYAVDIDAADAAKRQMAKDLSTGSPLVLNRVGAFASLCDGSFPGYRQPVLVCKTEEPGSKQLLAFQHGRLRGICEDMVHHLLNDVAMMGAQPLFVQDLIVCGKLEKDVVAELVRHMAAVCTAQGCVLTGGETSEQPDVLAPGSYVLGSSCIGVVEKEHIIDGSAIRPGDTVLALESSGLHTNGYTLVRSLLRADPALVERVVGGCTFLDLVMEPHRCYVSALRGLVGTGVLHGLAHITGGGIPGNLDRILPPGTRAHIDAHAIRIPPVFSVIRQASRNDDAAMARTFNLGVGVTAVVAPQDLERVVQHMEGAGILAYPIGTIVEGEGQDVVLNGSLTWPAL